MYTVCSQLVAHRSCLKKRKLSRFSIFFFSAKISMGERWSGIWYFGIHSLILTAQFCDLHQLEHRHRLSGLSESRTIADVEWRIRAIRIAPPEIFSQWNAHWHGFLWSHTGMAAAMECDLFLDHTTVSSIRNLYLFGVRMQIMLKISIWTPSVTRRFVQFLAQYALVPAKAHALARPANRSKWGGVNKLTWNVHISDVIVRCLQAANI